MKEVHSPTASPVPALPAASEIMRGVTFGFYARPGYFASERARAEVRAMAATGVGWVVLVVTIMQETPASPRMFRDFDTTPSDLEIAGIIAYLQEHGIQVQLRPMIECWDGNDRLCIHFPPDRERIPGLVSDCWQRWFASMRSRTRYYARLARETGCAMYGLDSEIDGFVDRDEDWRSVLAVAREEFAGPVTSTHTHRVDFLQELPRPDCWFRDLDFLSTSFYFPSASTAGADAPAMIAALQPVRETYRQMARLLGKPIFFGECGARSVAGTGTGPASWDIRGAYDGDEQARYLEAVLSLFWDEPWWAGLYWWKWDEQNHRPHFDDGQGNDLGFTIRDKPAQAIMRRWFERPERRGST